MKSWLLLLLLCSGITVSAQNTSKIADKTKILKSMKAILLFGGMQPMEKYGCRQIS